MKLDDFDQRLERLREASERGSANLVELEIDPSRRLLESSALAGESAARWSAASAALTELWRRQGLLEELVRRADNLRGSRRAEELRSLLDGRSIELASSDVPLTQRDLFGRPEAADRCSADELLASMSAAFDDVKTVVGGIGRAWEALIPKLDTARHILQESSRLAEELDEPDRRELESASTRLARLSASVTADPLSVRDADVGELTDTLLAIRADLEASATLKRSLEARILEARELHAGLRTEITAARAAHEELLVKVAAPRAPPPVDVADELERELGAIAEAAQRGSWRQARRGLEQWTARTSVLIDEARQTADANRAPIEARNQFRALLEAYQVKASRLGLLEDPRLEDICAQARQALYTAPTDLALAAQLVRSYQQALSGAQPTPEAML